MDANLFGETVVDRSIAILREFEPPEGYWGAFSGGKDSVVLKEVTRLSGVKVEWHYNVTTIDPPELLRFIRDEVPDVAWDRPARSFYAYLKHVYGLPTRSHRWCCGELKERGGAGRITLTGVRAAESVNRSRYGVVQPCLRGGGKTLVHPILHWSTEDVWAFIRANDLPYCSLYDEGWKRLGCVFCPFATQAETDRARERWPRMFARLLDAVAFAYPRRPAWQKFGSPEAVLEWWLDRKRSYPNGDDAQETFAWDQFDEREGGDA